MVSLKTILYKIVQNINSEYTCYKYPAGTPTVGSGTTATLNIKTNGRPVYLCYSGDFNPTGGAGYWARLKIYRDGVLLRQQIFVSAGNSWNVPVMLDYLDEVPKGYYTYTATITMGSGTGQLGESNGTYGSVETPIFIAYEI